MTRVTTSAGARDPVVRPPIPRRPSDAADREATIAAPYLQAIAFTAQTFLGGERLEERIPAVLCRLGEVAQASRAYLFECEATPGGRRWNQRHEWVAPGITPQMDNPTLQDVALAEIGFGRWEKLLERGEIIHGLRADAPESEQKVMAEQDILSLAAVPIFVEQRWWGFIGFDDCVRGRSWSPGVLHFLRAAPDLFGARLARHELDERYRRAPHLALPAGAALRTRR
jgi:GAF domain-containing protein